MRRLLLIFLLLVAVINLNSQQDTDPDSNYDIDGQSCKIKCSSAEDVTSCVQACLRNFVKENNSEESQQISEIHTFAQILTGNEEIDQQIDEAIGILKQQTDAQGNMIHPVNLQNLNKILNNNKKWAQEKVRQEKSYFTKHLDSQSPQYLWIGCSDSRLNPNQVLGLNYGQVFILRNVANLVSPSDISAIAVIQYAVEVLKIKDIIVGGHYNCGGVRAAVTKFNHGPLQAWLSKLRRLKYKHAKLFEGLKTIQQKTKLLVQINVKEQVFNVASMPMVQQAWKNGQQLRIHGLVFDLATGRLVNLGLTLHTLDQLPPELIVVET